MATIRNQIKLAHVIKAHVPHTGCQSKEQKQQRSKVMNNWGKRKKAEKASCVTPVHVRSSLDAQHVQSFLRMFVWECRAAQFQWRQFVWNSLQSWFRRWKLMRDVDIWFLRKKQWGSWGRRFERSVCRTARLISSAYILKQSVCS